MALSGFLRKAANRAATFYSRRTEMWGGIHKFGRTRRVSAVARRVGRELSRRKGESVRSTARSAAHRTLDPRALSSTMRRRVQVVSRSKGSDYSSEDESELNSADDEDAEKEWREETEESGEELDGETEERADAWREGLVDMQSNVSIDRDAEEGVEGDEESERHALDGGVVGGSSSHNSVLESLIAEQSELLGSRTNPLAIRSGTTGSMYVGPGRDGRREGSERDSEYDSEVEEDVPVTPESRWSRYLRTLPADFFRGAEAKMQTPTVGSQAAADLGTGGVEDGGLYDTSRRRCVPYAGLLLSHDPETCPDLRYVYEQIYEIRIRRGEKREGYYQFKAVAGQLARFAVAVEVTEAESIARPGGLFELAKSSSLIRAFIGGFQTHARASTVYSKATLLGCLCRMAKQHFGKIESPRTAAILSRIDETSSLLGGFRRVEKATCRQQTAVMRDQDRRETFIRPADWYALQKLIMQDMTAVWSGVSGLVEQFGQASDDYLDENHALVRKYSLLLLVFVLFTGGGQRPQAYTGLTYPTEAVIRSWEEAEEASSPSNGRSGGNVGTVKLYPTTEKTPRGTFYPGIVFPDSARAFFITYLRVVSPAIMRGTRVRDGTDVIGPDRTFLVHTV